MFYLWDVNISHYYYNNHQRQRIKKSKDVLNNIAHFSNMNIVVQFQIKVTNCNMY